MSSFREKHPETFALMISRDTIVGNLSSSKHVPVSHGTTCQLHLNRRYRGEHGEAKLVGPTPLSTIGPFVLELKDNRLQMLPAVLVKDVVVHGIDKNIWTISHPTQWSGIKLPMRPVAIDAAFLKKALHLFSSSSDK